MEEENVAKWQHKIEEAFHGPRGIIGERLFKLDPIESGIKEEVIKNFNGHDLIMEAFLDFYMESLENVAKRKETKWPEPEKIGFFTAVLIVTFWRFKSSFDLYWKGYFAEAISLLRAIFENVRDIVAIKLGVISIEERLFKSIKDAEKLPDEELNRQVIKHTFANDGKIRSRLIGEKSGLSSQAIKDFKSFLRVLNASVHKSSINIFSYFGSWLRGERTFPLFPTYNERLAILYTNYSMFIGWMVIRTLPLLQIKNQEFGEEWQRKYQVIDEAFDEAISNFPKSLGQSVVELVRNKFSF